MTKREAKRAAYMLCGQWLSIATDAYSLPGYIEDDPDAYAKVCSAVVEISESLARRGVLAEPRETPECFLCSSRHGLDGPCSPSKTP